MEEKAAEKLFFVARASWPENFEEIFNFSSSVKDSMQNWANKARVQLWAWKILIRLFFESQILLFYYLDVCIIITYDR